MVYITPEQYDEAYAKIVNESIGRTNSILILVAADPDALCSLKILLSLLRNDSVTYNMVPVSGYADLVRINRTWFRPDVPGAAPGAPPAPLASLLLPYPDLRSVICLNCGATADLADLFQLPPDVTLYVMDSHRPFHLRNLYGNPQVVIFDDGETDESLQIVRQAFERLERLENGEESESVGSGSKRPRSLVNDADNDDDDDDSEGLTMSLVHRTGDGNSDDQDLTQPSLPPARRRRTGMDTDVSVDADASFDQANDDDDDNGPDGNTSDQDPDGINQLPKRACRLIIAEHYQRGQYYGQATAVTLYILALQLSRETTDMLWFAIVGLTHQFLLDHIDEEDYWGQVQIYTDEVERLFPTVVAGAGDGESGNSNGSGGGIGEYGDVNEAAKKGDGSGDTMDRTHPGGLATAVVDPHPDIAAAADLMTTGDAVPRNMPVKRVTQPHGICYSEEFKFMLLRHWSLYESMQYSRYLSTRLGIWSERGRRLLSLMLAKMGFSLVDARQVYVHMSPENKARLRTKLDQVAPDYGCDDLVFPSFVRSYGWRKGAKLAASDAVYGLIALLKGAGTDEVAVAAAASKAQSEESPAAGGATGEGSTTAATNTTTAGVGAANDWQAIVPWRDPVPAATTTGTTTDTAAPAASIDPTASSTAWLKGFYTAYDALTDLELMHSGIRLAQRFQKAIVQQGMAIIERRSIKTLRTFRLAVITDNQPLFHHPLTLTQLAMFLTDALRTTQKRTAAALPFVIAAFNPVANAYTVVGLAGDPKAPSNRQGRAGRSEGDEEIDQRNPFSQAFRQTADRTGARTKHDSFEGSVVEIAGPDLATFIEYLHLYL